MCDGKCKEKENIKIAVKEAIAESETYVSREIHKAHHEFIDEMIKLIKNTKGTLWGTFLKLFVTVLLGLMVGGIILYVKEHLK
ncbi:MAG: hypothetical protein V3T30_02585 [Thermodesulfobacteriota bacterium]